MTGGRELRRSLVDMEAFFDIMKTSSQLKDGRLDLCATHMGEPTSSNGANGAAPACAGFVNAGLSVQLDDVHFGYRDRKVRLSPALRLRGARTCMGAGD